MAASRDVDVLILGAGPGGLAAAHQLASADRRVCVIERDLVPGGLMKSIHHGDFVLDLGRKELANRIPAVDQLWTDVLGDQFQVYPRRCGILHGGRIYESERQFAGLTYGMSWYDFVRGMGDLATCRLKRRSRIASYEDQIYQRIGRRFADVFYKGYDQKIAGVPWSQRQPESVAMTKHATGSFGRVIQRALAKKSIPIRWRHPALGTGQICTALHESAASRGVEFQFDSSVIGFDKVGDRIVSVLSKQGNQTTCFRPRHVISSLPLELVGKSFDWQLDRNPDAKQNSDTKHSQRRSTLCVYLFLNEPPRVPHSWLKVTCPQLKVARVTNYAAFSKQMVPPNQTCLCAEYCCFGDDPLLSQSVEQLRELAINELAGAGLIDPAAVFDQLVHRLPGVDGATDLDDWWTDARRELRSKLMQFGNLYCINQPGTNYATWCGMSAADAIKQNDRTSFDRDMDPSVLFDCDRTTKTLATAANP